MIPGSRAAAWIVVAGRGVAVLGAVLAGSLAACSPDAPAPAPAVAPVARPAPAPRAERPASRDARLREDCGGWEPPAGVLDVAAALADPATKEAIVAALDAGPLAQKIDVLRAGLRLVDDVAARACAARLEWRWIDNWECARCVDLLVDDVLRPDSEADFGEFRSYLGSAELPRFIRAMPPLPWSEDPVSAVAQLHRIYRSEHFSAWFELAAHPEQAIRDTAWTEHAATMSRWDETHDAELQVLEMAGDDGATPTGPGLPPRVRRMWLDAAAWTPDLDEKPWEPDLWARQLSLEATPAPTDADLLCDAVEKIHRRAASRHVAMLMLGKLSDRRSDALLRTLVTEDGWWAATQALARRGDEVAIAEVEEDASDDPDSLALLMEAAPARARKLIEARVLGADDAAAHEMLDQLEKFAVPGAPEFVDGFDWRRTSLIGFEAAALAKPLPAMRLARIGIVMPGCRTTRLAETAARSLKPGDIAGSSSGFDRFNNPAECAFLETAAPAAFREALWRIARGKTDDANDARRYLVAIGDAERGAEILSWYGGEDLPAGIGRSPCPEVRTELDRRLRAATASESPSGASAGPIAAALAVLHGLPEEAAGAFSHTGDVPPASVEALLTGRPVDALVALLDADPDQQRSGVGACDDPRVRAWLERLRTRRDLGSYWYATSQLAAMGDAAARADWWGAVRDGRYRIGDEGDAFTRTLGGDIPATLPFWISELRTNCCRANVADDVLRITIGFDAGISLVRTPATRAQEIWDAAGGRFVRSRIAGHFVPAPR